MVSYCSFRINELARQIDRIPIMEMEVERTQQVRTDCEKLSFRASSARLQEKSKLQLRFNEIRDEYNEALEDALAEAMRKYNEQSKYWKEKVANLEIARGNVKVDRFKGYFLSVPWILEPPG